MPPPDQDPSIQEARLAARQGRLGLAESLYSSLATRPDSRLEAISFLAFHRFVQQRYEESCRFAEEVLALRSDDRSRINLALSQFGAGDHASSRATLSRLGDRSLGYAPLLRGALHYLQDDARQALACFESYFSASPGSKREHASLPPLVARLLELAEQARNESLRSIHERVLDDLSGSHGDAALRRIRRAIVHFHEGNETWQHESQKPSFFYVPGLPPQPWFERTDFSWVDEIERRARAIHDEFIRIVSGRNRKLLPYVTAEQDAPRESWGHLIGTDGWQSLHLLKGGRRVEPNASDMPTSMAALELADLPDCAGNSPEAFFSMLAPHTEIPSHHGLTNFKLVAHLALDIPDGCGIRVGGHERNWRQGQVLLFDDSFAHEAWNHSGRHRTVLIFDVWHPALSTVERHALTRLFAPIEAFFDYRLSRLKHEEPRLRSG